MRHPSKDIIGARGTELEGRNIVLCITGSVAATRCPDLARALMRHGAEVRAVLSEKATELVTPQLMHWATGNPAVRRLTGAVEHVELAQWADVVLVAPATANTIGKMAGGIDDTPPTSVVSVAQGLDRSIGVVPAMHSSMYTHDIIQSNMEELKRAGFRFLEPRLEEGKAKIPPVEEIMSFVMNIIHPQDLEGERVLVTAGPTVERLDPVRFLTNRSSGKMGVSVARAASARGADVTLVYGPGTEPEPSGVRTIRVETTGEMMEAVEGELEGGYDLFVAAAAPQDLRPEDPSGDKIRRGRPLDMRLVPTVGILDRVSELDTGAFLVGFKAECDVTDGELEEAAEDKLREHDLDLVVANDVMRAGAGFESETNEVILHSPSGSSHMKASKNEIANAILDRFVGGR